MRLQRRAEEFCMAIPGTSLRRGDLVDVASPAEILATLDERGRLEGLPFMPEMAAYCGGRFTVSHSVDRVCDATADGVSRRLRNAVLLAELRCDGGRHDGCQAECRLFWKEAWLRKVEKDARRMPLPPPADEIEALMQRTTPFVRSRAEPGAPAQERWSCQSTELRAASEPARVWDPRGYLREWTTGNVGPRQFLRVMCRALLKETLRKLGLVRAVHVPGTATRAPEEAPLHLQPGELVRVKTRRQVAATLDREGRHLGLWFDNEMLPYCGGEYRVRQRISRFIDDRDGRMVRLKTPGVTLDEVTCSGTRSLGRWFCPRAILPFWRECWLERVGVDPVVPGPAPAPGRVVLALGPSVQPASPREGSAG
jgi:hypothetical protein